MTLGGTFFAKDLVPWIEKWSKVADVGILVVDFEPRSGSVAQHAKKRARQGQDDDDDGWVNWLHFDW